MGEWFKQALTPHEIYEYLTTGPGSGTLDEAQANAKSLWAEEDERAQLIRKQAELIRTGWEGSASDGAFGAAQPLAASALNRVDELDHAQDLLDRQSGSFNRAKNSVLPVPPEPPQMDLADPNSVFVDYEKEVTAYQADAQHNIEVFRDYDGASDYNETNIPKQYSTVNNSGGTISVTSDDAQRGGTGTYIEVPDTGGQPRGGVSEPYRGPGGPGGAPVSGPPVSGPVPNPSLPPQQTTPSNYVPPAINTPGHLSPTTYQPTPGPGQPGFVPGPPVSGVTGGSPGGPGARGGGYGGGPGARGGAYGGSPGSNAGPGAGARGPVPGPGAGVGAVAAEEAAARRAAAAGMAARGGAPGAMGGAPLGAGRGKGDEDQEHQRKVLIETDGESMFGSDELTAPQVIGDDEYEDD